MEKEDEGTYVCRADNQFGAHHVSAFLTVTGIGQFRLLVQYVHACRNRQSATTAMVILTTLLLLLLLLLLL